MPVKKKSEKAASEEKKLSLEEAFSMLDEITRSLEAEDISLEDSFGAYQKGIQLLIFPSYFSTVTPGQLATFRLAPV